MQSVLNDTSIGTYFPIIGQKAYAQQDYLQFLTNMNNSLTELNTYAKSLRDATNAFGLGRTSASSIFRNIAATSNNSNITASSLPGGTPGTFNVQVNQIATKAQQQSNQYNNTDTWQSAVGNLLPNSTFNISQGGTTISLDLTTIGVSNTDTMDSALNKIATEINTQAQSSGATLSASVVSTGTGTERLVIQSTDTGAMQNFTISDTNKNVANLLGLTNASNYTTATDANYTVDGVTKTSTTNTVTINNGFGTLTFNGTTSSAAKITFGTDGSAIADSIESFIYEYNNMISFANQNNEYVRSNMTANMNSAINFQKYKLKDMGINVESDGTLTIQDKDKLITSINNDPTNAENVFTGSYQGIVTESKNLADSIITSPFGMYATKNTYNQSDYSGISERNVISNLSKYMVQEQIVNIISKDY
jgi:flagellar hook-associated protein 2